MTQPQDILTITKHEGNALTIRDQRGNVVEVPGIIMADFGHSGRAYREPLAEISLHKGGHAHIAQSDVWSAILRVEYGGGLVDTLREYGETLRRHGDLRDGHMQIEVPANFIADLAARQR